MGDGPLAFMQVNTVGKATMQPTDNFATFEPGALAAVWRYKWIVVVGSLLFLALGVGWNTVRSPTYSATASLVLEDQTDSALFDVRPTSTAEALLAEQQAIISSDEVAARASAIATQADPSFSLTPIDFATQMTVSSDSKARLLAVAFRADTAAHAQVGANSLAQAYQDVRKLNAQSKANAQADKLDEAIQLTTADLSAISDRIESARLDGSDTLDRQLAQALSELIDLRQRRQQSIEEERGLAGGDPDAIAADIDRITGQREAIRSDIDDLFRELQTAQLLESLEEQQPALAALLQTRTDLLDLRRDLTSRSNELRLEASLATSGIAFYSPAHSAVPRGLDPAQTLLIMAMLGAAIGVGVAYYMASWQRTFARRRDPEAVLGSSLLAEVPEFGEEGVKSALPVRDSPSSASAESFRFATSSIDALVTSELQEHGAETDAESRAALPGKVLVVVSAASGDGRTVVTANVAYAEALSGSRVLVVDGDFGSQALTKLLLNEAVDATPHPGLTDGVAGGAAFDETFVTIGLVGDGGLAVMGQGLGPVPKATFFRSTRLSAFFEQARSAFDLVLIDAPPLLRVAYAGALVRLADGAIVVVRHHSDVHELAELRSRMELTGVPTIGYIYSRASLRRDLAKQKGSVAETPTQALQGQPQRWHD